MKWAKCYERKNHSELLRKSTSSRLRVMEGLLEEVSSELSPENEEVSIIMVCLANPEDCTMEVSLSTKGWEERWVREISRSPNMEGFPCYSKMCILYRKSIKND